MKKYIEIIKSPLSFHLHKLYYFSMIALFLLALFKPGEELSKFSWLVRPAYVINISHLITYVSILIILFSLICFILLFLNGKEKVRKDIFLMNMFFVLSVFFIQINSLIMGGDVVASLIRIFLSFSLSVIFINYFSNVAFSRKYNEYFKYVLLPPLVAGIIYICVNFSLYLFDRSAVIGSFGRMYGITEHPNFFGVNCAIIGAIIFRYIKNQRFMVDTRTAKYSKNRNFILLIGLLFITIYLFVLSGSRTSMVIFFCGILLDFILSRDANKYIYVAFILTVSVLSVFFIQGFINEGDAVRVLSTENTRREAWQYLIDTFMNFPYFGIGLHNLEFTESSILRALASSGLFGSSAFILINIFVMKLIFSEFLHKIKLGVAISPVIFGVLLGSFIEGYLLESLSFPVFIFQYLVNIGFLRKVYKGN